MGVRVLAAALVVLASCGASPQNATNPCITFCNKLNSCGASAGNSPINCALTCDYGGNLLPGLAPAPSCPDVAAQQACIDHAVQQSCEDYMAEATSCLTCSVLVGSPCASDDDCQKYRSDYRCDLGRPGGYCMTDCSTSAGCFRDGACVDTKAPSFAAQAPPTEEWCLETCRADSDCRTAEGYTCVAGNPTTDPFGVCDAP
jgi:hypothetical protein